ELLVKAKQAAVPLTREHLQEIVAQNDKQRFAFSADRQRIRASQGHSIPIDLQLAPTSPPDRLFHGTARKFLDAIQEQGLVARGRNHVHLSSDAVTARAVGGRHGEPVVLTIQAKAMASDGYFFYFSANGVWLTDAVPTSYIVFPA
ncbi:MAG: RNA 2'-phosphotransferase, partial [Chloroflexi bacterium]|nr:RNA 2'-phosphotransferase [Chloroflexota bacterium]